MKRCLFLVALAALLASVIASDPDTEDKDNGGDGEDVVPVTGEKILPQNAAKVLEGLKSNYDGFLSPGQATNGKPTSVNIAVAIVGANGVDIVQGTISLSLVILLRYRDERLLFTKAQTGLEKYNLNEINSRWMWDPEVAVNWVLTRTTVIAPYTTIAAVEHTNKDNMNVKLFQNEALTIAQELDVRWYPFDKQIFTLKVGSDQGNDAIDLTFSKRFRGTAVNAPDGMSVENFRCFKAESDCIKMTKKIKHYGMTKGESSKFTRLYFYMPMSRNYMSYLLVWFFPMQVIVAISYSTFFQDPVGDGGRDGIVLTAFLAMVMYQMEIRTAIPKVQQVTFIEVYLFVYTFISGFACIEYVWVVSHFRDDEDYDKLTHLFRARKGQLDTTDEEEIGALLQDEAAPDVMDKVISVKADMICRWLVAVCIIAFNAASFAANSIYNSV